MFRPHQSESSLVETEAADFVVVTDEEINEAIRLLARHAKQVAEGAGAASLAAAIKLRDGLHGKKVVGVLTGGNISADRFAELMLTRASARPIE